MLERQSTNTRRSAADRLLADENRDELVRLVTEAGRAVSRDLGAGRGGVVLSALG